MTGIWSNKTTTSKKIDDLDDLDDPDVLHPWLRTGYAITKKGEKCLASNLETDTTPATSPTTEKNE